MSDHNSQSIGTLYEQKYKPSRMTKVVGVLENTKIGAKLFKVWLVGPTKAWQA